MKDSEIEGIIEENYSCQKTKDNYLHRLRYMRDVIFGGRSSVYAILATPDVSYMVLREKYPNINTRKNSMTLVLALFKKSARLKSELGPQLKKWKEFHSHMDSYQDAKYKKHAPDKKQIAKYTPFEDIEKKYEELRKSKDPHATQQDSLQYVLLSIIVSTPPKRSDYGKMLVFYDHDPNRSEENYIVVRKSPLPSYMVFNKYKTAKVYNRIDQELGRRASRDVKDSLRRHPREYLFVNRFGGPFEANDAFSKYVIRTFRRLFGRDTGITMLRHIFITEKVSFDDMDDDELEDIAKKMMHSTALQRKYNWNRRGLKK